MAYGKLRLASRKVDLGDGYWAVVRPLTKAQSDKCQEAMLGNLEGDLSNLEAVRARLNTSAFTDAQLVEGIVEWNLDFDEDGVVSPVTLENVRRMHATDSGKVLLELRSASELGGADRSS